MNTPRSPLIVPRGQAPALKVLGAEVRFLCDAVHTGGAWSLMQVDLPLHAGPPPHVHDWDEAYLVLLGEVEFTLDRQTLRAGAGDFILVPGNVLHGFRGLSVGGAQVLVFDAPAHAAGFFREVDRQVRQLEDLPKVPSIGAANGIHFAKAA